MGWLQDPVTKLMLIEGFVKRGACMTAAPFYWMKEMGYELK